MPGEITSALSDGTNALLRAGATACTGPADVLEVFGLEPPAASDVSAEAERLLELLPAGADELARLLGLAAGPLAALLAELELAGIVVEGEGVYRSAR